jgi:hypothetical protein
MQNNSFLVHFYLMKKTSEIKKLKANELALAKKYGFNRPIKIPKILFDFFECHFRTKEVIDVRNGKERIMLIDRLMSRAYVTRLLYIYCSKNNLRLENDKRIIIPDKYLRKLFGKGLKDRENLTFSNFQTKLVFLIKEGYKRDDAYETKDAQKAREKALSILKCKFGPYLGHYLWNPENGIGFKKLSKTTLVGKN